MIFFPQLFYKLIAIPFGFQTLQIHLNYYTEKDFLHLKKFIEKNHKKIITFSQASDIVRNNFFDKLIKFLFEKTLKIKRAFL